MADVVLDREPSEGAVHVTPALLLSFVTVAVNATVSFPSTVADGTVTVTTMETGTLVLGLLPQPERPRKANMVITKKLVGVLVLRPEGRDLDLDIWRPFNILDGSCRNYTSSEQVDSLGMLEV